MVGCSVYHPWIWSRILMLGSVGLEEKGALVETFIHDVPGKAYAADQVSDFSWI